MRGRVPLFKEWGNVMGIDVGNMVKIGWLFEQLPLGLETGDKSAIKLLFRQLPLGIHQGDK